MIKHLNETRTKKCSISYLSMLRTLEKEQNLQLREPEIESQRNRMPVLFQRKKETPPCPEDKNIQIWHDYAKKEPVRTRRKSLRPVTVGGNKGSALNREPSSEQVDVTPFPVKNRHVVIRLRNGPTVQEKTRVGELGFSTTFYHMPKKRAKSAGRTCSRTIEAKPCYGYCGMCNEKNKRYNDAMKGLGRDMQKKLRDEWNRNFIEDF